MDKAKKQTAKPESSRDAIRSQIKHAVAREEGLRRWIFALVIFILTAGTFALSYIYHQYAGAIDGAAASFLTSLIFTLFYVIIVEAAMRDAQSEALTIETEQVIDTVRNEIDAALQSRLDPLIGDTPIQLAPHWRQLLPIDYFPPSDDPNKQFGDRLAKSVGESQTYIFRGGTGRHVPTFLANHGRNGKVQCRVLLLDPRADTAIRVQAQDRARARRQGNTTKADLSLDETVLEIRENILDAIKGLFALQETFRIEIRTCADNLFYRSEITDNEAFVSFFTADRATRMPPTYVHQRDSFYYNAFLNDFEQSWGYPVDQFEISSTSKDEALRAFLERLHEGW